MRGSGDRKKQLWIKDLCTSKKVLFLGIQETKMTRLELFRIKTMWGNYKFDYASCLSRGMSGGLLSIWDPIYFKKDRLWCDSNFLVIRGKWYNSANQVYMLNVYAPQDSQAKVVLWHKILNFMDSHMGDYVVFGDFNEVRMESDRFGTVFNRQDANRFNAFIFNSGLTDLPLGGKRYSWMNKFGTKMSLIDRFLVSQTIIDSFPNVQVTAMDRGYSDHCPLLLHNLEQDFGPTPFKFFHSWMNYPDLEVIVKQVFENDGNIGLQENFQQKLKRLKLDIK
ncbi:uncharacterized protein [Rutidosis leptorrhynchoides]|uniref:uncharacterized protein n=1 Tax=Rutidosis leptorrhynchoides TaxID=125765 RepID=UPI003A9A11D5